MKADMNVISADFSIMGKQTGTISAVMKLEMKV